VRNSTVNHFSFSKLRGSLIKDLRKIGSFLAIVAISLLHYCTPIMMHDFHAVYQRLYYMPIILCAYWFGFRWGFCAAAVSALFYLPHIIFQWACTMEMFTQYVEVVMFFVIGSLVGILSDVQRKQQKQIQDTQAQISRMDRVSLLGQLAAGLAHEIRNPLGSLMGSDEILAQSLGKDHPKYEFVEILQKEHRRLRDKLNEFLSFARPAPACIIPNNLNDIVRATTSLAEKQIQKSGCSLHMELDKEIRDIPVDADKMKQILLNLILNASQAMPDGGKIILRTGRNERSAFVSVEDQGQGIDTQIKEKIFEPFFTTKKDGTGLGLSIVKQLLETMNGTINVRSDKSGSLFTIRIPG
jgi:two-component system sensor histidine kinase HydH